MFTNPSKKEMSLGLGAHKLIQNKYCNEFAIILNVYFKSPAPTASQRGGGSVGCAELPRLKTVNIYLFIILYYNTLYTNDYHNYYNLTSYCVFQISGSDGVGSVGCAELPRLKTCSSSTRGATPATVSFNCWEAADSQLF